MSNPCRDCEQHNEYGQKLASHEVKIVDMKETIRDIKSKLKDICGKLDRFCTNKMLIFVLSIMISLYGGSICLQFSMSRDIGTVTTKVETIQKVLEEKPWMNTNGGVHVTK